MFGNQKKIERYFPGKIITAADLNALIDQLEKLLNFNGDGQIQLMEGPGGTQLSLSKYIIPVRRFQLYTPLAVGGNAEAKIVFRDGNGNLQSTTNPEFLVTDTFGQHWGSAGDYGYCWSLSDSSVYWEIISVAHMARWVKFTLDEPLGRFIESALAVVDNYWDGYQPPGSGGLIRVYNMEWAVGGIWEFIAASNSVGYAVFDEILSRYRVIQIQC